MRYILVENKYILYKKIGEGGCGCIYKGVDKLTKQLVAVKLSKDNILLKNEARMYYVLGENTNIPQFRSYGKEGLYTYLIIDLLDSSLRNNKQYMFSPKIKIIGDQLVDCIKSIHDSGIIHRDIKPDNFMLKNDKLFVIDFGLACVYSNKTNNKNNNNNKQTIGTDNYRSTSNTALSKKDDIESIGYVLCYLYYGKLEWQDMDCTNKEQAKRNISKSNIFYHFIKYAQELPSRQQPDYNKLKTLINVCLEHT